MFLAPILRLAGKILINKYTATAAAGALAVTAGPVFVEHGARAAVNSFNVNRAIKDYDKKLALRDQSSYKPIR